MSQRGRHGLMVQVRVHDLASLLLLANGWVLVAGKYTHKALAMA
jgi:hypothetical protein